MISLLINREKAMKKFLTIVVMVIVAGSASAQQMGEKKAVDLLSEIERVNDEYQATHSATCDTSSENVSYFFGNLEAYRLTGKATYYEYADTWCRANKWDCEGGDSACFAIYEAMNTLVPAAYKTKHCPENIPLHEATGVGKWLLEACQQVREMDKTDKKMEVTVSNPTADNRCDVVEISAEKVFQTLGIAGGRQVVVRDGDGVEVPYQLTYDGRLLIQAFVRPFSSCKFTIEYGCPRDYRLDVNGRIYPNREDDLAFENDKCAWRFYGPKMHLQGVNGFDVFAKNTTYPIQDVLYNNELSSYSLHEELQKMGRGEDWAEIHRNEYTYHRNRGQGMDAYSVGKTLGAGAPALIEDGHLVLPDVYQKAEILDNGPLRFTVRETMYEQNGVREIRLITLDKGTHMARCEVSYEGVREGKLVCSGIVIHDANDSYVVNPNLGYIAYADAMDTPQGQNGQLYLACLYTDDMESLQEFVDGGTKHVIGQTTYKEGTPFVYYFGSAWSRYDVPTMSVWDALLAYYARSLRQPLLIE